MRFLAVPGSEGADYAGIFLKIQLDDVRSAVLTESQEFVRSAGGGRTIRPAMKVEAGVGASLPPLEGPHAKSPHVVGKEGMQPVSTPSGGRRHAWTPRQHRS